MRRRTRLLPGGATVHALVTDAGQRQALVAVRELGRAGVAVGAVDGCRSAPAFSSRWCAASAAVRDFVDDQDEFVDQLLEVCSRWRPSVLIPVHDGSVEALRRRRAEVEQEVTLAMAHETALAIAVDKTKTLSVAQEMGMRVPRGVVLTNAADVESALSEVGLPAVVKPAKTWVQSDGIGRRLQAEIVTSRQPAAGVVEAVAGAAGSALLQEYLPGDREALSFLCADGRIVARFAQRASRTQPALGGNSVLRVGIEMPSDISDAAERLVLELGLEGYSEVEFRRAAGGEAALMEINPRLSASVEAAVRAGVPFPTMLCRWAEGERVEPVGGYRMGLRTRWLGGDLRWLEEVMRSQGHPDVPSRAAAVGTFFADFLKPASYDYLDVRDPAPALSAIAGGTSRLRRRAAQRTVSARGAARSSMGSAGLDTEVAVVGAGPYALALSAHLSAKKIVHEVFGEPMDMWRSHMPTGMYLKSEGFASNISDPSRVHTLAAYCRERGIDYGKLGVPIALETFAGYGEWFQQRLVPDLHRNWVEHINRGVGAFELSVGGSDAFRARSVVLAPGMMDFAWLPQVLRGMRKGAVLHTCDYPDPELGRGRDVAVIGAGQSALEAAALTAEHGGNVRVVARRQKIAWNSKPGGSARPLAQRLHYPESGLGEGIGQRLCADHPLLFHAAPRRRRVPAAFHILGPAGAWWLRPRVEGKLECMLGREVAGVEGADGRVRLHMRGTAGSEELTVDHVVAGTGYRLDVGRLGFLDPGLRELIAAPDGAPILSRSFESSVEGLYFTGFAAAASFGPLMRFVFGTEFAARTITRSLARRARLA